MAHGYSLLWGCFAGLTSLDVSADSTVVITGSEDMTAKISNLHTGKVLGTFQGSLLSCTCYRWCPWLAVSCLISCWQQLRKHVLSKGSKPAIMIGCAICHVLHQSQVTWHYTFVLAQDDF